MPLRPGSAISSYPETAVRRGGRREQPPSVAAVDEPARAEVVDRKPDGGAGGQCKKQLPRRASGQGDDQAVDSVVGRRAGRLHRRIAKKFGADAARTPGGAEGPEAVDQPGR